MKGNTGASDAYSRAGRWIWMEESGDWLLETQTEGCMWLAEVAKRKVRLSPIIGLLLTLEKIIISI